MPSVPMSGSQVYTERTQINGVALAHPSCIVGRFILAYSTKQSRQTVHITIKHELNMNYLKYIQNSLHAGIFFKATIRLFDVCGQDLDAHY